MGNDSILVTGGSTNPRLACSVNTKTGAATSLLLSASEENGAV